MNKEKYFEIRKLEKENSDYYRVINKINVFFESYKDYTNYFQSQEVLSAIKKIRDYTNLLEKKATVIGKKIEILFTEYQKECKHEIAFYDSRDISDGDDKYYCPLCRRHVKNNDVFEGALIFDVDTIFNCESPSQFSSLYDAIDYIITNNLGDNVTQVVDVLQKFISNKYFYDVQKHFKVRRKLWKREKY